MGPKVKAWDTQHKTLIFSSVNHSSVDFGMCLESFGQFSVHEALKISGSARLRVQWCNDRRPRSAKQLRNTMRSDSSTFASATFPKTETSARVARPPRDPRSLAAWLSTAQRSGVYVRATVWGTVSLLWFGHFTRSDPSRVEHLWKILERNLRRHRHAKVDFLLEERFFGPVVES